jgi:AcrR family transcriptional regulator
MAPNPETTRRRLVDAAERLFAERGIDAVSLREITAAAEVRNATALQYHFGDRAGIVRAVLAKHHGDIEAHRHRRLDDYQSYPDGDLRTLVGAFVRPAASKLSDPDGGRAWLRVMAQVVNRPDLDRRDAPDRSPDDSVDRWRSLVAEHLPEVAVRRLHRRFTAIRITHVELARRAAQPPARRDDLFISHLVDLVTAVLSAPLSPETESLLGR